MPLPGVVLTGSCPHCGKEYERDLGEFAACFPVANAPFEFDAYCFGCQKEWVIPIFIELSVRLPTQEDLEKSALMEKERSNLSLHQVGPGCLCANCQEEKLTSEFNPLEENDEEEEDELPAESEKDDEDFFEEDEDLE
jgi:hypothetical protein